MLLSSKEELIVFAGTMAVGFTLGLENTTPAAPPLRLFTTFA